MTATHDTTLARRHSSASASFTLPAHLAGAVRDHAAAHGLSADEACGELVLRGLQDRPPDIVPLLTGAIALLGGVDHNDWVAAAGDLLVMALDRLKGGDR